MHANNMGQGPDVGLQYLTPLLKASWVNLRPADPLH